VARVESSANLLEAKQALLTIDMQISDLTIQLNDALGLPLDTKLVLDPNVDVALDVPAREESLKTAFSDNPQIKEAMHALSKARAAHGAANAEYIPDVTAFARHSYQNGVPFVDRNFGTFGIHLTYDLFDAGKRKVLVQERRDEVSEAEENLKRTKDDLQQARSSPCHGGSAERVSRSATRECPPGRGSVPTRNNVSVSGTPRGLKPQGVSAGLQMFRGWK
jgi:outer membrane protein TolC